MGPGRLIKKRIKANGKREEDQEVQIDYSLAFRLSPCALDVGAPGSYKDGLRMPERIGTADSADGARGEENPPQIRKRLTTILFDL
jgi:hypothetical protein